jgi:hypothetical protein
MKYLFADEAGDLNFTPKSSRYFIVTTVSMNDFYPGIALLNLRHELAHEEMPELWESGFHATEDKQPILILLNQHFGQQPVILVFN